MLHGPQAGIFDVHFAIPSVCADEVATGRTDIGLVPCGELDRLGLGFLPDVGIACLGPVRSILLVCRTSPRMIRTLAADSSSRTSVRLARIVLQQRFGVEPSIVSLPPHLESMLDVADAALMIGDPALHLQPSALPFETLDLGAEWFSLTGLPMVFAVWAGPPEVVQAAPAGVFRASAEFGLSRLDQIASRAPAEHGVAVDLARTYVSSHIRYRLGPDELRGLSEYRRMIAELDAVRMGTPREMDS
jgi:predicted solute-binding protein